MCKCMYESTQFQEGYKSGYLMLVRSYNRLKGTKKSVGDVSLSMIAECFRNSDMEEACFELKNGSTKDFQRGFDTLVKDFELAIEENKNREKNKETVLFN